MHPILLARGIKYLGLQSKVGLKSKVKNNHFKNKM